MVMLNRTRTLALILISLVLATRPAGAQSPSGDASCPGADEPPRLKLALFDYAGAEQSEAQAHFSRFRQIIRRKLSQVAEEMLASGVAFDELEDLSVFVAGEDTLASRSAVRRYANQPDILKVLRGDIAKVDDHFEITSLIFLGARKGPLPREEVIVTMPVDQREYANTRDGHSVIAAYALAVDAAQRGCPSAMVTSLLSYAQNKIADIRRRGGADLSFITELEEAMATLLAEVAP